MKKQIIWILFILLVSTVFADSKIYLQSREFVPDTKIDIDVTQKTSMTKGLRTMSIGSKNYYLLQSSKNIERVEYLEYIPDDTWIVSIEDSDLEYVLVDKNLIYIDDYMPEDKLLHGLSDRIIESTVVGRNITIKGKFFENVFDKKLVGYDARYENDLFFLNISYTEIIDVASLKEVEWITDVLPTRRTFLDESRALSGADYALSLPYNVSGRNVVLAEWDGGRVFEHTDLSGRVLLGDSDLSVQNHATHVAGIMCGSGVLSQSEGGSPFEWRGYAPNASVVTYSWPASISDIYTETNNSIVVHDAILSQNSWGYDIMGPPTNCPGLGIYDNWAQAYDDTVRGSSSVDGTLSIVFSVGNDRDGAYCGIDGTYYGTVAGPGGCVKNVIGVGSVDEDGNMSVFSGWGPCDDGRLKPDIVANGYIVKAPILGNVYGSLYGTSQASPAVSGSIALFHEAYNRYNSKTPTPALVKAVLLQSAMDKGRLGPDYEYGYGLLNVTELLDYVINDNLDSLFFEENITGANNNETYIFQTSGSESEFKLTLVWSDYYGAVQAAKELVNDLDLLVYAPNGTRIYPWTLDKDNPANNAVRTAADHINNVEQVYVENPPGGSWTVVVNGYAVPQASQEFALVTNVNDQTGPSINVVSPTNGTYTKNTSTINVTISEDADVVWITINQTFNYSMLGSGSNFYFSLANLSMDKKYNYTIWANDTVGNSNISERYILNMSNFLPVVENITFSIQNPTTNDSVSLTYDYYDYYDTSIDVRVNWKRNSTIIGILENVTFIGSGNFTRGDNWTAIISGYDGKNWSGNYSENFTVQNFLPFVNSTLNGFVVDESDSFNISFNVSDLDGDNIQVNISNHLIQQGFVVASGVQVNYTVNTTYVDSGTFLFNISLNDSYNISYVTFNVTINEIEDADNDGVNNSFDYLFGNSTVINSSDTISNINVTINSTTNLSRLFNNTLNVTIADGNETIVSFNWTFNSTNVLNFSNLIVLKNENSSVGSVFVKGLTATKELRVQKIQNTTTLCIEDAAINSLDDISAKCLDTNEYPIDCPGTNNGYNCSLDGGYYIIKGLTHSGVKEQGYCGDGAVSSAEICDGTNISSSCIGQGFDGGIISCTSSCTLDTSACTTTPSSGGGGGGSSGPPADPNIKKQTWTTMTPGNKVMKISNMNIPLKNISFTVNTQKKDVVMIVRYVNGSFPVYSGEYYKVFHVNKTNIENSDIDIVTFVLKVNKSFGDVVLYRYTDRWQMLSAKLVGTSGDYNYWEAKSTGFSYFLIAKKGLIVTTTSLATTTTTTTIGTTTTFVNETNGDVENEITTTTIIPDTEEKTGMKYFITFIYILIAATLMYLVIHRDETKNLEKHDVHKPHRKYSKVDKYIKKCFAAGHGKEKIIERLVSVGWKKKLINERIKNIRK